ncbi:hypothetical protein DFH28DRAFT_1112342 [Melampsora americana]|nr:hypothetical protein DFH28DRAFT_1112342 [Melampsora americana]
MQISKIIISLFATFVVVSCGPTCIPSESNNYCIGVSITEATMSTRDSTLQSIDWRLLSAMSVVKCLDRIDSSWTQRLDQEGHISVGRVLASDSKLFYKLFSLHLIWISFLEKCSFLSLLVLLSQKKTYLAKVVRK